MKVILVSLIYEEYNEIYDQTMDQSMPSNLVTQSKGGKKASHSVTMYDVVQRSQKNKRQEQRTYTPPPVD